MDSNANNNTNNNTSDCSNKAINFKKLTKTTNFYFIRHGESAANTGGIIGGGKHHNPDLTETGELQASYLGAFFKEKKIPIDLIYTSTLTRAIKTTNIMAQGMAYDEKVNGKIIQTEDLIEIETGSFTDHTYEQVATKFEDVWHSFKDKLWDAVPGAESGMQVASRVSRVLNNAIDKAEAEDKRNIAIICHWGVLQWIHNLVFRAHSWKPLIHIPNCGISHFFITGFEKEFSNTKDLQGRLITGHPYEMWGYIAKAPYPDTLAAKTHH